MATRFAKEIAPQGLILRLDGGGTKLGTPDGPGAQFYTVANDPAAMTAAVAAILHREAVVVEAVAIF
jgi:hypothetical protein